MTICGTQIAEFVVEAGNRGIAGTLGAVEWYSVFALGTRHWRDETVGNRRFLGHRMAKIARINIGVCVPGATLRP